MSSGASYFGVFITLFCIWFFDCRQSTDGINGTWYLATRIFIFRGTAALSLNFGVIRESKTYSEELLIGSGFFCDSAIGTSESSMWFLSALSDSLPCMGVRSRPRKCLYQRGIIGEQVDVYWDVQLVSWRIIFFSDWFLMIPKSFLALFSVLLQAKRHGDDQRGND